MSWSTCYSGSNNIHKNLPPLMSDSRQFTKYDPNCEANNRLKKSLQLQSNYDYRQYLINNGMSLAEKNNNTALQTNINSKVGHDSLNHHEKYIFNNVFDNNRPFGYEGSDLKNIYLSRKQLQSRMDTPFIKMN
jgi:hypothetical protein